MESTEQWTESSNSYYSSSEKEEQHHHNKCSPRGQWKYFHSPRREGGGTTVSPTAVGGPRWQGEEVTPASSPTASSASSEFVFSPPCAKQIGFVPSPLSIDSSPRRVQQGWPEIPISSLTYSPTSTAPSTSHSIPVKDSSSSMKYHRKRIALGPYDKFAHIAPRVYSQGWAPDEDRKECASKQWEAKHMKTRPTHRFVEQQLPTTSQASKYVPLKRHKNN